MAVGRPNAASRSARQRLRRGAYTSALGAGKPSSPAMQHPSALGLAGCAGLRFYLCDNTESKALVLCSLLSIHSAITQVVLGQFPCEIALLLTQLPAP